MKNKTPGRVVARPLKNKRARKVQHFLNYKRIHFIGIGGIGVSALAGILKQKGKIISGSDKEKSRMTDKLAKNGIKIFKDHSENNLDGAEAVVYSLAIPHSNPELVEARRRKIPVYSYPEAVGELTKNYFTIAICGTHGKSTVTSMLAKIFIENDFDPTVIVGATLKELGNSNFCVGNSKILILEACEYKRAFLNYHPHVILLHTLDPDHLDYYKNFKDYIGAFEDFVKKLPHDGYFFGSLDDEDVHEIYKSIQAKKFPIYNIFTYGQQYAASDYYLLKNKIIKKGIAVGELRLSVPGAHNRINALSAFAVSNSLGIPPQNILKSLNAYTGASRRFELKGRKNKTQVYDDYAHHPAEIIATLEAAREKFPDKKICVVFQPHQYSRTKQLLKEFGNAFKDADLVIIPNIYRVRDSTEDTAAVSTKILVDEIKKNRTKVIDGKGFENTLNFLQKNHKKFDVIFTMGAGDVWKIGESFLKKS